MKWGFQKLIFRDEMQYFVFADHYAEQTRYYHYVWTATRGPQVKKHNCLAYFEKHAYLRYMYEKVSDRLTLKSLSSEKNSFAFNLSILYCSYYFQILKTGSLSLRAVDTTQLTGMTASFCDTRFVPQELYHENLFHLSQSVCICRKADRLPG